MTNLKGHVAHPFNGPYEGPSLDHIHFPIGGIGAGMFTLDGTGSLSHFSLQNLPNLLNEPLMFSALHIQASEQRPSVTRILEGPIPAWKPFFAWDRLNGSSGMGAGGRTYGLPRMEKAQFLARFPFATVSLSDPKVLLKVQLTGWSPFVPGDEDASSLPVGALEFRFQNASDAPVDAIYSYHTRNFLQVDDDAAASVSAVAGGIQLHQQGLPERPDIHASFAAWIDSPDARANATWFRGGWSDSLSLVWKEVSGGRMVNRGTVTEGKPSPGGSVYLPFHLEPGEEKTVRLLLAWYAPRTTKRAGNFVPPEKPDIHLEDAFYRPWYASRFRTMGELRAYWTRSVGDLRQATESFTQCFYDSTLPPEILEAVAANLTILKSPTVLRQSDGRMWAWEGSNDFDGSCHGTCTHVWNYAQAVPHLFPRLERGLRETEFTVNQDERGHQDHRANLPIGPVQHTWHAAADGQLGGVIKVYREWRLSGDTTWMKRLWPHVRQALQYGITTWDPDHRGALFEPHHNTYDIEFWGADAMCSSIYLSALQAAVLMGRAAGDEVSLFETILSRGTKFLEAELFNGEYFIQKVQWQDLHSAGPLEMSKGQWNVSYSPEALELLDREGPKYQYGSGCLSDGIIGEWFAWNAGLTSVLDPAKIESHLVAVHRHNFQPDLVEFPNPQRPAYAFGHEGGLLLCTWPRGGKPSLPMVYSDEVWTGIEYQVASHLISLGRVREGLEIVRACRRRYDGTVRNPFDELECGHWYARAMASYALLYAYTGARYDAVDQVLHLTPRLAGDFRSFLATATGYGMIGVSQGKPFIDVKSGSIDVQRIAYQPAP